MFNIKSDIMHYNYEIKHVPGETKCIADCLSRRPSELVGKNESPNYGQDLNRGGAIATVNLGTLFMFIKVHV